MTGNVLNHHLNILIKYLNMDEIRPVLRRHGVLLSEEADKLIDLSSQPKSHAVEELVTMLGCKGTTGFYYFKKGLEETKIVAMGHQDILIELSEDPEFEAIISDCYEK